MFFLISFLLNLNTINNYFTINQIVILTFSTKNITFNFAKIHKLFIPTKSQRIFFFQKEKINNIHNKNISFIVHSENYIIHTLCQTILYR